MAGNPNEEISQEFQNELNRLAKKTLATGSKYIRESVAGLIDASRQFGYDTTDLVNAVRSGDENQVRQCVLNIHEDTSAYAKAGKDVVAGIQRDCNIHQNEITESLENGVDPDEIKEKNEAFLNDLAANQTVSREAYEAVVHKLNNTEQRLAEVEEWKDNRLPERTKRAVNDALTNATTVVERVSDAIDNSFNKAKDFVKSIGTAIKETGKAAVDSIKKSWIDVRIGFKTTDQFLWKLTKKIDEIGLKFAQLILEGAQNYEKDHQRYVNIDDQHIKSQSDGIEQLKAAKAAIDNPGDNDLGDDVKGDDEGLEI